MSDIQRMEANRADLFAKRYEIYRLRELIKRAVEAPAGWQPRQPRWSAVGCVFSVGSTTATNLCREFGVDPDDERPWADDEGDDQRQ